MEEGGYLQARSTPEVLRQPLSAGTDDERPGAAAASSPRNAKGQLIPIGVAPPAGADEKARREAERRQYFIDRGFSNLLDEPEPKAKAAPSGRAEEKPRSSTEYRTMVPFWVGEAEARKDPKIEAAARKLVKDYLEAERGFGSLPFGMRFPSPRIHWLHHYQLLRFGFDRNGEKCFQVTILATMRRGDRQEWKTLNVYLLQGIPNLRSEDYGGLEIKRVTVRD